MITEFIQYLEKVKKYSPHTAVSYQNDLKQFELYLLETFSIEKIEVCNHVMIRSWIVAMAKENIQSRSINRKISTLNTYYKFLIKNGHVLKNPMRKVVAPKVGKRLPSYIIEEEIPKVLNSQKLKVDSYAKYRDELIIFLLYITGMRRSELLNMKITDINVSRKDIRVIGKGKKERIIPVTPDVIQYIKTYLQIRTESFKDIEIEDNFLILSVRGKKMDPRALYEVVKINLKSANSSEKKSPHVLRHSFATHLLNNGADINAIKEILGHANLGATQVYTHNSIERLKQVYQNHHPKA